MGRRDEPDQITGFLRSRERRNEEKSVFHFRRRSMCYQAAAARGDESAGVLTGVDDGREFT